MKSRNSRLTKILALCLTAIMIIGMLPVSAMATSAPPSETSVSNETPAVSEPTTPATKGTSAAPAPLSDTPLTIEGVSEKNLYPGDTLDLATLMTLSVTPEEQAENYELRFKLETEDTSYTLNGSMLTAGSAGAVYTVTYSVYDVSGDEAVLVETVEAAKCVITVQPQTSGNHTVLDTDNAYLTSFTVGVTDGAFTFDDDDEPGHDSNGHNGILRTFDKATYHLSATYATYDRSSYKTGKIHFAVVLPVSGDKARFDESSFKAWMNPDYQIIDQGDKTILIGSMDLEPAEGQDASIPGGLTNLPVTVAIGAMQNGDSFLPEFYAWMDHNDVAVTANENTASFDPAYQCGTHKDHAFDPDQINNGGKELLRAAATPLKISAALKLNVQLKMDPTTAHDITPRAFDFNDGNDLALNKGIFGDQQVYGRLVAYSLTLQLQGEKDRGFIGCEFPDPEKGVDVTLGLNSYYVDSNGKEYRDYDYQPLIWSYGPNDVFNDDASWIWDNQDGRRGGNAHTLTAPYSHAGTAFRDDLHSCFDSGLWIGGPEADAYKDSASVATFHVKDFVLNWDAFPIGNADYLGYKMYDNAYIGCFSAGEIWVVQPYSYLNKDGTTAKSILDEYGGGTFHLTAEDGNMTAISVSGQAPQGSGGENTNYVFSNENQRNQSDDKVADSFVVSQPGKASPLIHYGWFNDSWCAGDYDVYQVYGEAGCFVNGKDTQRPGEQFAIRGGFQWHHYEIESNYPVATNSLIKFDGDAIRLYDPKNGDGRAYSMAGPSILPGDTAFGMTYNILYGALKGEGSDAGRNWADDNELMAAQEDAFIWFTSLEALRAKGYTCVAVLQELRGDSSEFMKANSSPMLYFSVNARVAWPTDDFDPTGKVYMLYQNTKVWTKGDLIASGLDADTPVPSAADRNGAELMDFADKTTHTTISPYYRKAVYENNNYVDGHEGTFNQGDSLYILPYYVQLLKSVDHEEGREPQLNYNLNKGERTADFVITPQMKVIRPDNTPADTPYVDFEHLTTVTVEDTLPEGLALLGIPILNGVYDQDSKSVTGGIPCVQDSYVTLTEQGHEFRCKFEISGQTLIWTIEDVPIAHYKDFHLPDIHYTCLIGTPGNEETDIDGTNGSVALKNVAVVYATDDGREFSTYNKNMVKAQINVTKYGQIGLSKRAVNPYRDIGDHEASYILKYHNNGANSEDIFMVDALPYDGDFLGSHFSGSYTLNQWKLNLEALGDSSFENFSLYYTTDTAYRGQRITEDDISDWQSLPIRSDGTVLWGNIVPVAFALKGSLKGGASAEIALTLLQDTLSSNDLLCNSLSQGEFVVQANIQTVIRSISGLVWHDSNRNGIQDKKVITIPGIPVRLLDENGNVVTNLSGDICEMVTDKNGEYRFTNLPAGKFHVEFSDSDDFLLGDYKFSPYHAPNSRPTNDSDIVEKMDGDTPVADIEIELAQGAPGGKVSLSHLDGGFYAVTDITATKTWVDFGTGTRPDSIELVLYRNGKKTDTTVTLNAGNAIGTDGNVWTYTFEDLDMYDEDFEPYTYSVDEVSVPNGYEKAANGLDITNTLLVALTVEKITRDWDLIPADRKLEEITVVLLEDGKETSQKQVIKLDPATGSGSCSFTLTAQDCKDHEYTVKEIIPDEFKDFYTSSVSNEGYDFTVTNTYRKDLEISVQKVTTGWDTIPDNLKLSSITVNLLRDGELFDSAEIALDKNGSGSHTFAVKAVDAMGHEFTVEEIIPDEFKNFYTSSVSNEDYDFTITNEPVIRSLSIAVQKVTTGWDNIPDDLKLSSITVNLLRDGVVVDTAEMPLDDTGSGSHTFTVKEMDPESHEFTVEEVIPDEFKNFYTSSVSNEDYDFTITNEPVIRSLSIAVQKVTTGWDNIPDDLKLSSITVNLLRDGVVVDTAEMPLDDTGSGSYTFTVKEMDPESHEFTVEEVIPDEFKNFYTSSVSNEDYDFTITNEPVIRSLSIAVKKVTEGENIPADRKLSSITVNLLRDGVVVDTAEMPLDDTGSGSYTFTVKEMDPESHEFTVEEVIPDEFKDFYTSSVSNEDYDFTVTNTYRKDLEISVEKVTENWDHLPDSHKPQQITVNLLRDGTIFDTAILKLDENGSAAYTFSIKDIEAEGHTFTVEEVIPEDYKDYFVSSITETDNGYRITNTPITGELVITKTVTGNAGDQKKDFTFVVTFDAPGTFSYTGSTSGTLASGDTITLKHGEKITISGLPIGTAYQVVEKEANKDGYVTTASGEIGVIADYAQKASFVNHKDVKETDPTEPTGSNPPPTGDTTTGFALWMTLLLISVAGIGVLLVLFRRKLRKC